MFRPAKISVFLTLLGVLTASATPLDSGRRNVTFQPGRATTNLADITVVKPAQSQVATRLWTGGSVQRITSVAAGDIKVELNGVPVAKPAAAALRQAPVTKAGGAR